MLVWFVTSHFHEKTERREKIELSWIKLKRLVPFFEDNIKQKFTDKTYVHTNVEQSGGVKINHTQLVAEPCSIH